MCFTNTSKASRNANCLCSRRARKPWTGWCRSKGQEHSDMRLNVTDAQKKLPELIESVERGKRVTICRRGVPVVDLVRTTKVIRKKPMLGTLRGKIKVLDPDW